MQQDATLDDWLSLQDASEMLGVATSTLRRWGDAGRVPMKRTLGGHRRFARDEVAKLADGLTLKAGLVPATPVAAPHPWGIDSREIGATVARVMHSKLRYCSYSAARGALTDAAGWQPRAS